MAGTDDYPQLIARLQGEIQKGLDELDLPAEPRYLYDPVRYIIAGKGKRLRPILLRLVGEIYSAPESDLKNAGLAVELLHNFTLVHDDIMDGDDQRHGQPTVHNKWDESTAILTGDGIFATSQLLIGKVKTNPLLCWTRFNEAILEVCEGQAYDKEFEDEIDITMDQYLMMVTKKTGNLLGLCAELGGILGDQPRATCRVLYEYGVILGQAFQIQDDMLEISASPAKMGKSLGSDIAADKQTALTILARERNADEWQRFQAEQSGRSEVELCSAYYDYYRVTGILDLCRKMTAELIAAALAKLDIIPEAKRGNLLAFSELVLNRKK